MDGGDRLRYIKRLNYFYYSACPEFRLTRRVAFFESILTTFKLSIILKGSWGSGVNWLKPKIETSLIKFSLPKYLKQSV
jgi:hypothetical protein